MPKKLWGTKSKQQKLRKINHLPYVRALLHADQDHKTK